MRKITIMALVLTVLACFSSCKSVVEKSEKAIFTIYTYDEFGSPSGSGSGFFIESEGIGVTNWHVLDGAVKAMIKNEVGEFEIDSVLCASQKKDLLVFRVKNPDNKRFATLPITNKRPDKGAKVINIGSPLGLENTLSEGIISSYRTDGHGDVVQTTAAISPGCSGSPLMNEKGEVFAVVSFKSRGGENINFGIVIGDKFRDELDGKEFAKRNPKFNTKESDFRILNLQCNSEICLMLNAIEFSKSATTAYFTFTNMHLSQTNYPIYVDVSKEPDGFYIEDKATGKKYYATSASISTDGNASTVASLGEPLQFKVFFPAINADVATIDLCEGLESSTWKFLDINLEDYKTLNVDDSKYYREMALMQLSAADENNVENVLASVLETFSELVERNPDDGLSLNVLGLMYYAMGNNLDALSAFSDAIDANPNDALSYENRCQLYIAQDDYQSALNDINKAIDLCPTNFVYLHARAMINLNGLEDPVSALQDLNKCLEYIGPNPYLLESRAICYAIVGQRNAALQDIQLAYRLSNDRELDQRLQRMYNSL